MGNGHAAREGRAVHAVGLPACLTQILVADFLSAWWCAGFANFVVCAACTCAKVHPSGAAPAPPFCAGSPSGLVQLKYVYKYIRAWNKASIPDPTGWPSASYGSFSAVFCLFFLQYKKMWIQKSYATINTPFYNTHTVI